MPSIFEEYGVDIEDYLPGGKYGFPISEPAEEEVEQARLEQAAEVPLPVDWRKWPRSPFDPTVSVREADTSIR